MPCFIPHGRRSIHLKGFNYSRGGLYDITICAHGRLCIFGEVENSQMIPNALGQLVEQNWKDIPKHWQHIDILEYRVMPNHIHGVIVIKDYIESGIDMDIVGDSGQDGLTGTINCAPTVKEQREAFGKPTKGTIPTIIKLFKAGVTRQVGTSTMRELYGPIWQRGYYEHVITSEAELKARIEYIRNNPANWDKDDYYRK